MWQIPGVRVMTHTAFLSSLTSSKTTMRGVASHCAMIRSCGSTHETQVDKKFACPHKLKKINRFWKGRRQCAAHQYFWLYSPSFSFQVLYFKVHIPSVYSKLYIQVLYSKVHIPSLYSRFCYSMFYIQSFILQVFHSEVYIPRLCSKVHIPGYSRLGTLG